MARMRSRSTSLRFFSRCTWIRSDAGRGDQRGDRGVEVTMLLLQARQLLPQRTFVLVVIATAVRAPPGTDRSGAWNQ